MLVLPQQMVLPRAHEAFDDSGALKDERQQKTLQQMAGGLARMARAL